MRRLYSSSVMVLASRTVSTSLHRREKEHFYTVALPSVILWEDTMSLDNITFVGDCHVLGE